MCTFNDIKFILFLSALIALYISCCNSKGKELLDVKANKNEQNKQTKNTEMRMLVVDSVVIETTREKVEENIVVIDDFAIGRTPPDWLKPGRHNS